MTEQNANDKQAESPGGVEFPVAAAGWRSTSAFGRGVIADALRRTDPAGALGAEQETNWRSGYLTHFRRVIEAGLTGRKAALSIAADGLAAVHARMRVGLADGEHELANLLTAPASRTIRTATVT